MTMKKHQGFLWTPDHGPSKEWGIQHWYRADEADARIAELEAALRPFALAAMNGAEVMREAATSIRSNTFDGASAYIWKASLSLTVYDFREARRVLMSDVTETKESKS